MPDTVLTPMWTHCMVCAGDLGENAEVETFPVGARLAFDPAPGRLWVICPHCSRWNLTPLESRWEAIEALEKRWRSAAARVSTDTIGLARLRSGLELVRVAPESAEAEVAWWRWGRRRSALGLPDLRMGAMVALGTAGIVALPALGLLGPGAVVLGSCLAFGAGMGALAEVASDVAPIRRIDRTGDPRLLTADDLRDVRMTGRDDDLGWALHVCRRGVPHSGWIDPARYNSDLRYRAQVEADAETYWTEFTGERAIEVARNAFPLMNRRRSPKSRIDAALARIAESGGPERFLPAAAGGKPRWSRVLHYDPVTRLAMEIVLFQEEERAAMAGELGRLEKAWAEAERIAALADSLVPPSGWAAFLRKHRT